MRINYGYIQPSTNSVNKGTQSVTNDAGKTFAEIASQKAAEADKEVAQEKTSAVLDSIGSQAPDEVRQAWKEAEEATGGHIAAGGLYITYDGEHVHAHITQMLVQFGIKWLKGEVSSGDNIYNLLGNSVESAISVVEKALYDMDHPLPGQPTRSMEVQQQVMKERAFYEAFLDKLRQLS